MNGRVDELLRALLEIQVRSSTDADFESVAVWIDTAFNGELVFPLQLIETLKLQQDAATDAILADGQTVTLAAYVYRVDWFGQEKSVQVIANDGKIPLLGTGLLVGRVLHVDYADGTLTLD